MHAVVEEQSRRNGGAVEAPSPSPLARMSTAILNFHLDFRNDKLLRRCTQRTAPLRVALRCGLMPSKGNLGTSRHVTYGRRRRCVRAWTLLADHRPNHPVSCEPPNLVTPCVHVYKLYTLYGDTRIRLSLELSRMPQAICTPFPALHGLGSGFRHSETVQ